jgi:hypothetical protein
MNTTFQIESKQMISALLVVSGQNRSTCKPYDFSLNNLLGKCPYAAAAANESTAQR